MHNVFYGTRIACTLHNVRVRGLGLMWGHTMGSAGNGRYALVTSPPVRDREAGTALAVVMASVVLIIGFTTTFLLVSSSHQQATERSNDEVLGLITAQVEAMPAREKEMLEWRARQEEAVADPERRKFNPRTPSGKVRSQRKTPAVSPPKTAGE